MFKTHIFGTVFSSSAGSTQCNTLFTLQFVAENYNLM